MVLSVDEKSQILALDRTRPLLSVSSGTGGRPTHDHVCIGPTSLFAALNVATDEVIGQYHRRLLHQTFLNELDAKPAREPVVEIPPVLDNDGPHKIAAVKRWLLRHLEFPLDFTTASGSSLNPGEQFLGEMTAKRIRRGAFRGAGTLEAVIRAGSTHECRWLAAHP